MLVGSRAFGQIDSKISSSLLEQPKIHYICTLLHFFHKNSIELNQYEIECLLCMTKKDPQI